MNLKGHDGRIMNEIIKGLFDGTHPATGGFIMAAFISVLRVVYDRKETSFVRIMLESLICGALTVAAGSALEAMGFGANWYLGCGGFIGFMGSQSVRAFALRFISKRVD